MSSMGLSIEKVKILNGKYPPPDESYSPDLVELIRGMLSKEPKRRPTLGSIMRTPSLRSTKM